MARHRARAQLTRLTCYIATYCAVTAVLAWGRPGDASTVIPPVGTVVLGQTEGRYVETATPRQAFSNLVATTVAATYALALTPSGDVAAPAFSVQGAPGDTLYTAFTLENQGNATDSVALASASVPPSSVALAGVIFFSDVNSNGRFDAGEDDPSFLRFGMGVTITLDVAYVLATGSVSGDSYVEIRATSTGDPTQGAQSVVRVQTVAPPASALQFGPYRNARALPGGEGSGDDRTSVNASYTDNTIVFRNDILNESGAMDVVRVEIADTTGWPAGVTITVMDTSGVVFPSPPARPGVFLIGQVSGGETRTLLTEIVSARGPFFAVATDSLALRVRARSILDTLRVNDTVDRILVPGAINTSGLIRLEQTFTTNTAAFGDVVTLVVEVTNVSDSVDVDGILISESVHPGLDFLSSPTFSPGTSLMWPIGTLAPGERRESAVKFIVNSRILRGQTWVTGSATGVAPSMAPVTADPVTNVLRIENDIFGDEGFVIGDVFIDADGSGKREDGEPGVAGVAVFLESGEYALTDSLGKFSIPRVFSGYRVVRLDAKTLPPDVALASSGPNSENNRRYERLVHLLPSGNASVSFPLTRHAPPTPKVSRRVLLQELVTVQKRSRIAYQIPSVPSTYFTPGHAFLKSGFEERLEPIVGFLQTYPDWTVLIEGHTDSVPIHTVEFPSNDELSLARARAVKVFLTARNVSGARVYVRGHGERVPVASNATREGRAQNRRVEVTFLPPETEFEEGLTVDRVQAEINEITAVPDSFHVRVRWELTTDCPEPMDAVLYVHVPDGLPDARANVRHAGVPLGVDGARVAVPGLARSRGLECEVSFTASAADTHRLREIGAALRMTSGALADSTLNGGNDVATLQPLQRGGVIGRARSQNLWTWEDSPRVTPDTTAHPGETVDPNDPESLRRGFTEPDDGFVFSTRDRIDVAVRVPLGSRVALRANGATVDDKQIGQRVVRTKDGVEEITFYNVGIENGWNAITLEANSIGGEVVRDTIHVALSGRPTTIESRTKRALVVADGRSTATLRFGVHDELGLPVADGLAVTIVEGDSIVANADARPDRPGLQIVTNGGYVALDLRPRTAPGRVRVTVATENTTVSCMVVYVPANRSFLMSGIVEGRLGAFDKSGDASSIGLEEWHDDVDLEGQARVFAQGTTFGGVGLTARIDTERDPDDPLLKTGNPETQYPSYGDASQVQYAAPSERGNYVALEKHESYLRWGDFRTGLSQTEFLKFERASNGFSGRLASGDHGLRGFLTKSDFVTKRDEIPGDGTSGFYFLSAAPIAENSEIIVIETRDRFRPEKILERRPLVQHRDYTINYFSGSLLFKEPVPVTTREFNLVVIVVIYEVRSQGEGDYLYGLRGDVASAGRFHLGGTAIADGGRDIDYALYGVDGGARIGPFTLGGEFARSEDEVTGDGSAMKIETTFHNRLNDTSVYARKVDGDFMNPSFTGGASELASRKFGFDTRQRLGRGVSLVGEGFHHRFDATGDERANLAGVAKYETPRMSFRGGLRAARQDQQAMRRDGLLTILGGGFRQPGRLDFRTHWEKNIGDDAVDDYPDRLKSALTVPLHRRIRAIVNHEYLTAHDRPATHQLLAGIEAQPGKYTTAFTKYALNRTADDERVGQISGIKQRAPLGRGLVATVDVEGFRSFSSSRDDEYVAVKTGLNWLRKGVGLVEGQYEYRWARSGDRHLVRLNAIRELERDLAIVFKEALSFTTPDHGDNAIRSEGRVAGVYRPLTSPVRTLLMLKNEYDRFSPVDPNAITWRLVFTTDVNVIPAPPHELRLKFAIKRVEDWSQHVSTTTHGYLLLGQYVWRFAGDWDVDLWARYLSQGSVGTDQLGSGIELGRLFFDFVRIAAGYSVNGFKENDLSEREAWERGFGIRVQFILSDWLLNELGMDM